MGRKSKVQKIRAANLRKKKCKDATPNLHAPSSSISTLAASVAIPSIPSSCKPSADSGVAHNTLDQPAIPLHKVHPLAEPRFTIVDGLSMPRIPIPHLGFSRVESLSLKYNVSDAANIRDVCTVLAALAHSLQVLRLDVTLEGSTKHSFDTGHIPHLPQLQNLYLTGSSPLDTELLPDLAVQLIGSTKPSLQTCHFIFNSVVLLQLCFALDDLPIEREITWHNWATLDDTLTDKTQFPDFQALTLQLSKDPLAIHPTTTLLVSHLSKLDTQAKLVVKVEELPNSFAA